jgi:hypothetical protein
MARLAPPTPRPWLPPEDIDDVAARVSAACVFLTCAEPDVQAALVLLRQALRRLHCELGTA